MNIIAEPRKNPTLKTFRIEQKDNASGTALGSPIEQHVSKLLSIIKIGLPCPTRSAT